MHGGSLTVAAESGGLTYVEDIKWMRSLRTLAADATEYDRALHEGNDQADKAAGNHREYIEQTMGRLDMNIAEQSCDQAKIIFKALGAILSQWPRFPSRGRGEPQGSARA